MILRFKKSLIPVILLTVLSGLVVFGQEAADKTAEKKTEPNTSAPLVTSKNGLKNPTAEQLIETTIFVYGLGGGRASLNQIRKTAFERGKVSVVNAEGKMEQANYQRWIASDGTSNKRKIRLDQEFPTARYSLVFSDDKIFGIFNDSVFTPREDASRAFQNQIVYGLDTLLRYKENGSKLELGGREKMMGVDFFLVDVTDTQNRKTRFYISAKTFRVMMLDYEDAGIKYRRKFYDYNAAQGTLVAYRSVLYAGDKIVEETEIGTVTYGQKIDDGMFSAG
ncbi:MAG: hypothetical protein M3Q26_13550 [Acidobacteriota bacterium]|nr:hypothetical protein [Acidobacteriota bacterium]